MSDVAVVVLMAGRAQRWGGDVPKQLARLPDGRTLAERAADLALAADAGNTRVVVVVTGYQAEAVDDALGGRNVDAVYNRRWAEGQGTSVAAGIAALPPDTGAALVLLVDHPTLPLSVLDGLIAAARVELKNGCDDFIIFPTYDGRRGNPVIFGRAFFAELRRLEGDVGGRAIVAAHKEAIRAVAVDTPAIFDDADTPETFAALLARST